MLWSFFFLLFSAIPYVSIMELHILTLNPIEKNVVIWVDHFHNYFPQPHHSLAPHTLSLS